MKNLKSLLLVLIIFMFLSALSHGNGKKIILPEILKPFCMTVDSEYLYVAEQTSILIYSLKDFKFIKRFGREGSGPGEFRIILGIFSMKDQLVVNSLSIIYFFKKNGVYISERKTNTFFCDRLIPIGNAFVGSSPRNEVDARYYTINLFNSDLEKGKEIYRYKIALQPKGTINPIERDAQFYVYENKIFVDNRENVIFCFDKTGEKIRAIEVDIDRVKIPREFEEKYIEFMKNHRSLRVIYQMFGKRFKFPSHYPAIWFFYVEDARIYVVTHHKIEEDHECLVLDFTGKCIKKSRISVDTIKIIEPSKYAIKNGIFYQLVENFEDEVWELSINPI